MSHDELIRLVSSASNRYGDKLDELMTEVGVFRLPDVTEEQAYDYCKRHNLLPQYETPIRRNTNER